jgi:hypothetical protein
MGTYDNYALCALKLTRFMVGISNIKSKHISALATITIKINFTDIPHPTARHYPPQAGQRNTFGLKMCSKIASKNCLVSVPNVLIYECLLIKHLPT